MTSAFRNTFSVWHALFLREILDRFFGSRAGWAWQILEPAAHLGLLCLIWSYLRARTVIGAELVMWIIPGMLIFFLFRRTAIQTLHSVDCNKAFFNFRQVRPFDAAFARGGVEAFSMALVALVCICGAAVAGKNVIPHDIPRLLGASAGVWTLGFGYGLITCVAMRLVQDLGHVINLLMMPMYVLSGVIWPAAMVPAPYRDYLALNPVAHGVEIARECFFPHYYTFKTDMMYLWTCAVVLLAIGMILFKLLENRLLTK